MIKLTGQKRELGQDFDERKELRGIIYGGGVDENIIIMMDYNEFAKIYKEAGTSQIINLNIDKDSYKVLVKDIDLNPVTDNFRHIDFYAITENEKMEVNVPFEFIGESSAEKLGNILNKIMLDISINSLPKDIPAHIEIDLSVLETVSDSIRLEDIKLPEGVSFTTENMKEVIVSVSIPKEEVEEESVESEVAENKTEETSNEEKKED